MKKLIILLGLLLNIGLRICVFSQEITDTIPPVITISENALYEKFSESYVSLITNDSIIVDISCLYYFPNNYLNIPEPVIQDETDPSPTVAIDTFIDTANMKVTRKWTVTDSSGNIARLTVIIKFNGTEYQLRIYKITINDSITILNSTELTKRDTVFLCTKSDLKFFINSYWECARNKKEFFWNVNGKPAYSENELFFSLSLDTLPNTFNVIIQANVSNNNLSEFNINNSKIEFVIKQLQIANKDIIKPTCTGSADGSINIINPGELIWDNNTTNPLREGLNPGKYWVTYLKNTCSITDTIVLEPDTKLDFDVSDVYSFNNEKYVTITNNSTIEGNYLWHIGDTIFSSNDKKVEFKLTDTGNINFILSLLNSNCSDSLLKTLIVNPETQIGNIKPKLMADISPNPFQNKLHVRLPDAGFYNLRIYTFEGMQIYSKTKYFSTENTFDAGFLKPGIYLVQILSINKKSLYQNKIVKMN